MAWWGVWCTGGMSSSPGEWYEPEEDGLAGRYTQDGARLQARVLNRDLYRIKRGWRYEARQMPESD